MSKAKKEKLVVSMWQFGNYIVPFSYFIKNVFDAEFLMPPRITKKTLKLGALHSPDAICSPFKFQLGNYIEALDNGANALVQVGGPCRLTYYGEAQEQILKDLGYDFKFFNLADVNIYEPMSVWNRLKDINKDLSLKTVTKTLLIAIEMVKQMDYLEGFIRENVGFEVIPGTFELHYDEYLKEISDVTSIKELKKIYNYYVQFFKRVKINKPKDVLKVGIVGEYYTIMEPFSNHFLEKELAKRNIMIKRTMNVSSTVFQRQVPKLLKKDLKYVKYDIGATGVYTINAALEMIKDKYDGIIHVKSFGCTPEIDSMSILQRISSDHDIPILYLSFDTQTSETGFETRLEAFHDMILMQQEPKKEIKIKKKKASKK